MEYSIKINFNLHAHHKAVAFYPIKDNGCCDSEFFMVTSNKADCWSSGINYSCQCTCGMWCTNGHPTIQEAVDEYIDMCERFKKRRK